VSEQTKARVRQAAAALGYAPNMHASCAGGELPPHAATAETNAKKATPLIFEIILVDLTW